MKHLLSSASGVSGVRRRQGFSLVELMVSVAILSILLTLIFTMLDQMQKAWKKTRQDVAEFKDTRLGFEEMDRRLSQATLNAYWGYRYGTKSIPTGGTIRFGREIVPDSTLHFVCGPTSVLFPNAGKTGAVGGRPTHAVFFQAPFGFCIQRTRDKTRLEFDRLNSLLNAWGYYIEFNSDELDRPRFLNDLRNSPRPRPRYRLMEFRQPSEYLQVYKLNLSTLTKQADMYRWFNDGNYSVNSEWNSVAEPPGDENFFRTTRPIAENVIAMILLPRTAEADRQEFQREDLAPDYLYDSRRWQWAGSGSANSIASRTRHQLPPIIDVTFVAVNEGSFSNYAARNNITSAKDDPEIVDPQWFRKAENFRDDMDRLESRLRNYKLDFRVFNKSIRIRESKWLVDNNDAGRR